MAVFRYLIRILLTVAFLLAGATKLTPQVSPDVHAMHLASAPEWIKVFSATPIAPYLPKSADDLRVFLGVVEVMAAIGFWTPLAGVAEVGLLPIMAGAAYYHFVKQEPYIAPVVLGVLSLLLLLTTGKSKRADKDKQN